MSMLTGTGVTVEKNGSLITHVTDVDISFRVAETFTVCRVTRLVPFPPPLRGSKLLTENYWVRDIRRTSVGDLIVEVIDIDENFSENCGT